MRVVVVMPTYNEAENVDVMLGALLRLECAPDVLVVDDNSPDGTGDFVRAFMRREPRVALHPRRHRQGLGAAYVDGFSRALSTGRYDAVVQMDADGSHAPADVDRLVAALETADVAIGSRYIAGGSVVGWPWPRRLLSRSGNLYARLWLRLGVRDLTGGFKAWRADTLARIELGQVRAEGYTFQVETTARAVARGAKVIEVPITFRDRVRGVSKMDGRIAREALRQIPSLRQGARH